VLVIPCPLCGERPYTEFHYGGDASKRRPALGGAELRAWHDYLFLFDNPKGPHREYWQHHQGCRQWLLVVRNTATNEVGEVILARHAGTGAGAGPGAR
jgi:sarcosine oxidase subunit delta